MPENKVPFKRIKYIHLNLGEWTIGKLWMKHLHQKFIIFFNQLSLDESTKKIVMPLGQPLLGEFK
jgi:hypothetical protein